MDIALERPGLDTQTTPSKGPGMFPSRVRRVCFKPRVSDRPAAARTRWDSLGVKSCRLKPFSVCIHANRGPTQTRFEPGMWFISISPALEKTGGIGIQDEPRWAIRPCLRKEGGGEGG